MIIKSSQFKSPILKNEDGSEFLVGTIFGIGRNYAKHIKELNNKDTGEPVVFTKPSRCVHQNQQTLELPSQSTDIHHEVELAIIVSKKGKDIQKQDAKNYIGGAAIALDLTLRDLQSKAKKQGHPWFIAKGFDASCPISTVYPINDLDQLSNTLLYLEKNDTLVQSGNTNQMIYSIPFLISYLSQFFTLYPGDIILTGTPEGVGPIVTGDKLTFWSDFSEKTTILCQ